MKKYAIIRFQKIKNADQHNAIAPHNFREFSGENIDRSRTGKNIIITPPRYINFDAFVNAKREGIRQGNLQRKPGERKARFPRQVTNKKTKEKEFPALSQEFVFTHSPGAMSEVESIEYLRRADQFIRNWFQDCEVLSSVIHLDETTPHLQIHISYFDQNEKRFVQKALSQAGLTDIDAIRNAFQKEVAEDYDLIKQDGQVVGKQYDGSKASIKIGRLKEKLKRATTPEAAAEVRLRNGKTIREVYQEQAKIIKALRLELKEAKKRSDELLSENKRLLEEKVSLSIAIDEKTAQIANLTQQTAKPEAKETVYTGDLRFEDEDEENTDPLSGFDPIR